MKFRTSLPAEPSDLQIDFKSNLVLLGSCFSENIGNALMDRKFSALVNPFGISYNPISLLKNVKTIVENKYVVASDLESKDNSFFHYDYHGSNNSQDAMSYVSSINNRIDEAHDYLKEANILFISLGTANVFIHEEHGIVNNCHKMPNALFTRRLLNFDEIIDSLTRLNSSAQSINPDIKIVYTVSPIRHIRDGLVADRRSKSLLLAALTEMINDKNVFYFPSYELLIDDLRDYRFYKEDLIHPSDQAIRYIWEYFSSMYFSDHTIEIIKQVDKINNMLTHKVISPSSIEAGKFRDKIKAEIEKISNHIPQDKWSLK